jgi:hypothetical protein
VITPLGVAVVELKPSLTCAGILITTTDKNTSDEAVRHFSVIVDYSKVGEAKVRLSQGDAEQLSANISLIDSIDILFSDSTSWGNDESIKQFVNGDINRIRGTMYAYETLWSEGGPARIRHWYLQCKEDRNPFVICQPWGPGICLLRLPGDWCPKTLPPELAWQAGCLSERPK